MNVSGNAISPAPFLAASLISFTDFATVLSRSRNTGVAWTAAAVTFSMSSPQIGGVLPAGARILPSLVLAGYGLRGVAGAWLPELRQVLDRVRDRPEPGEPRREPGDPAELGGRWRDEGQ